MNNSTNSSDAIRENMDKIISFMLVPKRNHCLLAAKVFIITWSRDDGPKGLSTSHIFPGCSHICGSLASATSERTVKDKLPFYWVSVIFIYIGYIFSCTLSMYCKLCPAVFLPNLSC